MNIGGYSDIGPREANEDNFYVFDFPDASAFSDGIVAYIMVSDGMGGYQGGDVASGLAVACAQSYVTQLSEMAADNKVDLDVSAALAEIALNAHEAIKAESASRGNASMGATIVEAFMSPTHAWIAHIGDSRAYLVRDGEAVQLTEDHSQVGRMLSRGIITEEEAQVHPSRNRIERALGFSDGDPEIDEVDLVSGDWLVLCSDGVYTVLDSSTLATSVTRSRDAERAARRVVRLAISKGTDDNSTAAIAWNVEGNDIPQRKADTLAQRVSTRDAVQPTRPARRADASGRSAGATRPAWAVAVPLLMLIAMVGLTVFFFLKAQNDVSASGTDKAPVEAQQVQEDVQTRPESPDQQGQHMNDSTSGQNELPAEETVAPDVQNGETTIPREGEAVSSDALAAEGYATYTLSQDTELKYVDYQGIAHNFASEPWYLENTPWLLASATVTAREQAESYGMLRSYQQLADTYLEDLHRDLVSYKEGALSFSSGLSRLFAQDQYRAFLQELSSNEGVTFEANVAHLIVDAINQGGYAEDTDLADPYETDMGEE